MNGGWIKIYYAIQKHWIWERPRYLKWWLDLLMLAEWEDTKKMVGTDEIVLVKRGQLLASVSFLRERWAYKDENGKKMTPSPPTILKFLKLLEVDGMITRNTEISRTHITLITIVNYNEYQSINTTPYNDPNNDPYNEGNNDPYTEIKNIRIKEDKDIYGAMPQTQNNDDAPKQKKFIPPSVEEVDAYIREKGYSVDASTFVSFYESKGWMIGKNKMKDWKAAVRTWNTKQKQNPPQYGTTPTTRSTDREDAKRKRGEQYAQYFNDLLSDPRSDEVH